MSLEDLYAAACNTPSDINEHCPVLRALASRVVVVTELGVRTGVSTVALLSGRPKKMTSYDIVDCPVHHLEAMCPHFRFHVGDSLKVNIEPTDLLFIDTKHTGEQVGQELMFHCNRVFRYIVLHDTVTFGDFGEDGRPGLAYGIGMFLLRHPHWRIRWHYPNNNGLAVLERCQ